MPTPIDADKRPDLGAARAGERDRRAGAEARRHRHLRIDRVPGLHRGNLRADPRTAFRAQVQPRLLSPATARSASTRAIASTGCRRSARSRPARRRRPPTFVDKLYGSIVKAGTHPASLDPRRRSRQGDREHAARRQHRAHQRARHDLQPARHRHRRRCSRPRAASGTSCRSGPGLVGGHCIGVDPYYLTHKAQQIGYHPEMILAGRRINDNMALYVAGEVVRLMAAKRIHVKSSRILVLGLAFKENTPDLRNSKVADVVAELAENGARVDVWDPWVSAKEAEQEYGIRLIKRPTPGRYDAIVLAVGHREFAAMRPGGDPPLREAQACRLRREVPVRARAGRRQALMRVLVDRRGGFHRLPRRRAPAGARRRGHRPRQPQRVLRPHAQAGAPRAAEGPQGLPLRAHRPRGPRGDGRAVRERRVPAASCTSRRRRACVTRSRIRMPMPTAT